MVRGCLQLAVLSMCIGCHRAPRVATALRAQPDTFTVVGVVREELSGHPMPRVIIEAEGGDSQRVLTDASGKYQLGGLRLGSHVVSARMPGYYIERREIAVNCPVIVTSQDGTVVSDPGPCDQSPATLNFYLRPQTVR